MAIERAEDTPTDNTVDEDDFKEEDSSYNFRELMDCLYADKDLILTIPADQEQLLRAGLIIRKAKDNAKLKSADVKGDGDVLSFLSYPAKDKTGAERPDIRDVRVKLAPKKSVTVLEMRRPNDEF